MNINPTKNADIESATSYTCPVTGLPILRKSEWTEVSFGTDYRSTLSILGDSILFSQPSGYCTLHDVENGLELISKVANEALAGGRPFVQIEDLSNVPGTSLEARKYFIDNMKRRERLLGLIFCGASPMFKLSIKLGKRLNIVKFNVQIVNDYSEAIKLALKMLSTGKIQPDGSLVHVTPSPPIVSEREKDDDEVCPVTGLPITSKPEWTDIDLGEGYSVTFKFIGDRILLSIPRGGSGKRGMENLMRERTRVLGFMHGPDEPFCELKDYSKIQERVSRAGRDQFTRGMTADKDRIMGFIGYNAPLEVRLALKVGRKLYKSPFPMSIVRDYETAVKEAVEILKLHGYGKGGLSPEIITYPDWSLQLDGFSARFEVIDSDIFHAATSGLLEEEHVAHVFRMQEKVTNSVSLPEGSYYFIGGVEEVTGSRKARKLYFDYIMQWYEDHPFQKYVFYGANRFLRAAINIASPLAPFNVRMVKDLDSALEFIAEEKAACASKAARASRAKSVRPASLPTVGDAIREPLPSDQTQQYVDELLQYLGSINWETDGVVDGTEIDPTHPFGPVFDAIALVKNDLDELFLERKQAEENLRESEEKFRNFVETSADLVFRLTKTGRIDYISSRVEELYGYRPDELIGKHLKTTTPVKEVPKAIKALNMVLAGNPLRNFEINQKDKAGRLIPMEINAVPVYQGGKIVGFQGIMRDITERRQAAEALRKAYAEVEARVEERTAKLTKTNEQLEQEIAERKRAGRLLQALNQAARSMEQTLTQEEIFAAVAGELKKLGFTCIVFLTDESQKKLFIKYWSYETRAIETAEKLVGLSHEDFQLLVEAVDEWKKVVWEKETVFIENVGDIVWQILQPALPGPAKRFIGPIAKMLKLSKDINAPLIVEDKVIGMFAVQSDDLTADDIPAITAFAHQIAAAWRKAKLLQNLESSLAEQVRAEESLRKRTAQLQAANKELETFSYSVSHDLRAPLRSIDGFSQIILEDYTDILDENGQDYLHRVRAASQRMAQLIDDMLKLSRLTRGEIRRETVDLSALAQRVATELQTTQPDRQVEVAIEEGVSANGDARLLRVVLENLLGNAWKYTARHPRARIEFGMTQHDGTAAYFVRDDGAGFDMAYADKLFSVFQRLHSDKEFDGTGIGLATVQRIIHRHGGRVWAEGAVERGATFYFTL